MEIVTLDPMTLTDLESARWYLKNPSSTFDDTIRLIINAVTAEIEMYTKRYLLNRVYDTASAAAGHRPTMVLSGDGGNCIMAREYPVNTVTSIVELYPDGTTTRTLNITGLMVEPGHIIRLPYDTFSRGRNNIQVKGTFGYDSAVHTRECRALEQAALRLIQTRWQDRDNSIGRGTTFGVEGQSVQLISRAIPPDIERALEPFMRLV